MYTKILTPDQERLVDAYGLEMLKNGLKCGIKTDRKIADQFVKNYYKKYCDLPSGPKQIVYVASPEVAIRQVHKSEGGLLQDYACSVLYVNWYSWWVAYYHAGIHILKESEGVEADLISDLDEHEYYCKHVHAILPCENVCFVIEYPSRIAVKNDDLEKFELHYEGGNAVEYSDGTGFCCLNGVVVPDWISKTKKDRLSVKKIMAETNVDVRREGLMRLPLEKILKDTKAKLLDRLLDTEKGKHWDYALYEMDFHDGKRRVCLRMYDVASDAYPIERVDETECKTVLEALAWRDGEDSYRLPSIRT